MYSVHVHVQTHMYFICLPVVCPEVYVRTWFDQHHPLVRHCTDLMTCIHIVCTCSAIVYVHVHVCMYMVYIARFVYMLKFTLNS